MKFLSENFNDLRPLYINQLRSLLSVEEHLVRTLPDMVERATDQRLRQALQSHFQETEVHVTRLEKILGDAKGVDPTVGLIGPLKNKAIVALVEEAEDMILDARNAYVRDVVLIAAAQRIEHYEIAAYGAVRHFAHVLGDSAAAELLDKTLKEEGHADHLLSSIAERVNPDATVAA